MDNKIDMESNGSSAWPYIIVGSAVGGALGYLFMSESGKKVRRSLTNPDQLSNNIDDARSFVEQKMRVVTDRVHGALERARQGIQEGQLAYRDAGQEYRSKARKFEAKNNEITSNVHSSVDKINRSATRIEGSVLDPICEMGALVRGIERGIRSVFGKFGSVERKTETPNPIQIDRSRDRLGGF